MGCGNSTASPVHSNNVQDCKRTVEKPNQNHNRRRQDSLKDEDEGFEEEFSDGMLGLSVNI